MSRSTPSSPICSAPGKAFLIGEYAVLEGAEAVVTAVDVRAHAHAPRSHLAKKAGGASSPSPFVAAALDEVGASHESAPVVTTQGFAMGGRKLGFGSSAAVVASVLGRQALGAGEDVESSAVRDAVFGRAYRAHKKAQRGKGSGADVAASVYGGTLGFQLSTKAAAPALRALPWPAGLCVGFFDAGQPASTTAFIKQVHEARDEQPQAYARIIELISAAAKRFVGAFAPQVSGESKPVDDRRWSDLAAAVHEHVDALRALGGLAGADIITKRIAAICDLATQLGLAAKPSGAGGGDLVVVFGRTAAQLDAFAVRLRNLHGIARLGDLAADAPGLRPETKVPLCSRLPGFYKLDVQARRARLAREYQVAEPCEGAPEQLDFTDIDPGALPLASADAMVENVVGTFALPVGIATNFQINGCDVLVPMCVEEASVIAAASNAAKMIRAGGGFVVDSDPPWMIAQIQLVAPDPEPSSAQKHIRPANAVAEAVLDAREQVLALADEQHPRLVARGGGARDLEVRVLDEQNVVAHVLVDCQDAMGANLLNTVAEAVAPLLETTTGWSPRLRILSNLADRRSSHVVARVPFAALDRDGDRERGAVVAGLIADASRFAELDPYRAATHNKGIMNGADAVVMATGNDWRAMEASAHAYAARNGRYEPLATWRVESGVLVGRGSLPTAVGVVGGATRSHPGARLSLAILGHPKATRLGQVIAAAGIASNLAALRALATEGIQRGHMGLHARAVALSAGAEGPEVEILAKRLITVSEIKLQRAEQILREMRKQAEASDVGESRPPED